MKVVIRVDASLEIGSGHVIRCLTIAKVLKEYDFDIKFWMKPLEGNLINLVEKEGFTNITKPENADLYIIDHYDLGCEWEKDIKKFGNKVVVIDDLGRSHDCDLLLDQNIVLNYERRYDGKLPSHCVKLLGPKYLIMRDEFVQARKRLRIRSNKVERILVFMGGSDPTNETCKVLEALTHYKFEHVDVVVGNSNPLKDRIKKACIKQGYEYHCQINYMANLMQKADFAIGAGGATLWERCYVGLPSSATIVAKNQIESTSYANKLGVVRNLGWHEAVTVETYKHLFETLSVENMTEIGLNLTYHEQPNLWLEKIMELIK